MRLDDKLIEEIRQSASISQVISQFIPITKKGRSYVAVCPFHDDHDPSLSISEDKQIYKCFVCGKGGNVFNFVKDYTKCSFPEAVAKVAEIIGRPIDLGNYQRPKPVSKYQKHYDLMQDAIDFTSYALNTYAGEEAKDYLLKRGLDKEVIDYFEVGYDPKGDTLYRYLKNKGYSDDMIEGLGIARAGDYGYHDIFQNRVTFPIHNINGDPIAFSARALDASQVAKYINTSETIIYHKGDVVYNYHRAKDEAKRADRVIISEGVMDVIALKRAGINNVVATLGTSCTNTQLLHIAKLSKHMVFFYDGDEAGRKATMRACEMAMTMGYEPYVIVNDTDKDPDEIINEGKAKDLRDMVSKEIMGIEYAFDYYMDLYPFHSYQNKKSYINRLSKLISYIKDSYDRDNFYHELATRTGLPVEREKITKKEYNTQVHVDPIEVLDGLTKAEYTILKGMMDSGVAVDMYRKELGFLYSDTATKIADLIIDAYRKDGDFDVSRALDMIDDKEISDTLVKISMDKEIADEFDEEIFMGSIKKIKLEIKKSKLQDLKQKIAKKKYTSEEELEKYLKEYNDLLKEIGGRKNG